VRRLAGLAALAVAALSIAACTVRDAETPGQRLYAVQAQFNTVLQAAGAYVALPDCRPAVAAACADPDVKERIKGLVNTAANAIAAARPALTTSAGGSSVAVAAGLVRQLITYLVTKEILNEPSNSLNDPPDGRPPGGRVAAGAGDPRALRGNLREGEKDGHRRPRTDAGGMGRA
tara:strand:+ start:9645 stop:10169 length:525 start_codon:yes stop_codon:yes gene_type:complete